MSEPSFRRPKWVRIPWIVLAIVLGLASATVFFKARPVPVKVPNPNGYDTLVRAGSLIQGTWPNQGDLAKANLDEVKTFLQANQPTLEMIRVALGQESLVPIENTQEGVSRHFEAMSHVRNASRLLLGEARVFEAEGQPLQASRTLRDLLELGQVITQGGLGSDVAIGWMFQTQAITGLRKLRDQLPSDDCRGILADFQALDRRRVMLQAVVDRHDAWYRGAYNPFMRFAMQVSGIATRGKQAESSVAGKAHDRIERAMRFAMVELAIHAYHEDKKAWPKSVQNLVPGYLSAVPIDPTTGQGIDYPANLEGELTDDLNAIARPDGEVSPKPVAGSPPPAPSR